MNELFESKYVYAEIDEYNLINWEDLKRNRYGFVYVKNPHYMKDDDERKYLIRKPTPKERREIIINTVIECNGRTFSIPILADRLGVTDRMVQSILRQLQKEGLIEIIPKYNKSGAQKGNSYRYIGEPCERYGSGLTLQILYSTKQDAGFRDWAWKEHIFDHDRDWHCIYPLCKEKFKSRVARKKYLQDNNLPLIVPEPIKYLTLRYCYWQGETDKLHMPDEEFIYSKDGTKKIAIEPLGRTERISFFGYTLSVDISGTKENPVITITNAETEQTLGVFTWFDENIIKSNKEIDGKHTEQFFILGDFATK